MFVRIPEMIEKGRKMIMENQEGIRGFIIYTRATVETARDDT